MNRIIPFNANNVSAPSAATAAVVTYAATGQGRHTIQGLAWSYSATPSGGNITIADSNFGTVLNLDIPTAGVGTLFFPNPLSGDNGASLTITLASGGGTVVGKLTVFGEWNQ